MVPPEEIEDLNAPTTLPADFGEWDNGEDPGGQPPNQTGYDGFPGSGAAPRPVARTATARVAVLPTPPAPVPVAARPPNPASYRPTPAYEEVEQYYQQPRVQSARPASQVRYEESEDESEDKGKRKKLYIAVGSVAALLIVGALGYSHMHSRTATTAKPAVATQTAVTNVPQPTTSVTPGTTSSTPEATTTDSADTARPLTEQSDQMNRRLNAPSRISGDLKVLAGKEAPPPTSGFGASGMDGMGNAGAVFSGQSGPKVKVASPTRVTVSAGVAVGLLMQKTAPKYPPIAKSARVSGTVVIQATISKAGLVENPRVVSGPTMLRQAAVDAVKTWRFRPYLLDGQPVEVETTVNVVFTL